MTGIKRTETIKNGDSAWKVAERNLKTQKITATNEAIIAEMNRLAQLNGCENYTDFNEKFFNQVGKEYIIDNDRIGQNNPARDNISTADATRVEQPRVVLSPSDLKIDKKRQYIDHINNLKSDTQRIIEFNKDNYKHDYYGIVNKKTCQLEIYNKDGKCVKTFTVGVGKKEGDDLQSNYFAPSERKHNRIKSYLAQTGRYTTAGEFTLDELQDNGKGSEGYRGTDGKLRLMQLKGDNRGKSSGQMAIHKVPNFSAAERSAAIRSQGLEDNRMSYGCVNLLDEDYDEMHKYLGEGCKIYVLPEEEGNKLVLEKQDDGTYKFEQLYHRKDKRSVDKAKASTVKYDVKPENEGKNEVRDNNLVWWKWY